MNPAALIGGAAALAGVAALRRAWSRKPAARGVWIVLGWALILGGTIGWAVTARADKAIAAQLMALSFLAYGAVLLSLERRAPRRVRAARADDPLEPQPRERRPLRALLRFVCAVPLSAAAAIAVAVAVERRAPMPDIDRLVLAGMVAPVVWAAAVIWSLYEERVARPALGLAACALAAGWLAL